MARFAPVLFALLGLALGLWLGHPAPTQTVPHLVADGDREKGVRTEPRPEPEGEHVASGEPQAPAEEPYDGEDVPAALLEFVGQAWDRPAPLPTGRRISTFVVKWRMALPPPADVLEDCRRAVLGELRAAGRPDHAKPDVAKAMLSGFVRDPTGVLCTYTWKDHLLTDRGWVLRARSWPNGNATVRARVHDLFLTQTIGAGGRTHQILVNQEPHTVDSFGNIDSVVMFRELRDLARVLRGDTSTLRAGLRRGGGSGDELTFVVPLRQGRGDLPLLRHLPPDLVADTDGTLGYLGARVMLERGGMPRHVVLLGHAGKTRMEMTFDGYEEIGGGSFLPRVVQRTTFLPDGRTPLLHVRCLTAVEPAMPGALPFVPAPGLPLVGVANGQRVQTTLAGRTQAALSRELEDWIRKLRTPGGEER